MATGAKLLEYSDVLDYVRTFRNASGDPAPFDLNGLAHILLAAVDNLAEVRVEQDLEDLARATTRLQREYLIELADYLRNREQRLPDLE